MIPANVKQAFEFLQKDRTPTRKSPADVVYDWLTAPPQPLFAENKYLSDAEMNVALEHMDVTDEDGVKYFARWAIESAVDVALAQVAPPPVWTAVKPTYPPKDVLVLLQLSNGEVSRGRWRNVYSREGWFKENGNEFSMNDPDVLGWRYEK